MGLGGLAWLIVTGSLADVAATRRDPAAALDWRPAHPEALQALAAHYVEAETEQDVARAERLARAALRASPLVSSALTILGLAAERRGDAATAERLIVAAAARSHRDRAAHLWLLEQRAAEGGYAAAWRHAELLLLADRRLYRELSPWLVDLAGRPGSAPPLAAQMTTASVLRADLLRDLCWQGSDPNVLRQVLLRLRRSKHPPTREEAGCYVRRLAADKDYAGAYAGWLEFMPGERRRPHNGGFDPADPVTPFEWTVPYGAAGEAMIALSPDGRGHALRVAPSGREQPVWIEQLVRLASGEYVLSFVSRTAGAAEPPAMAWTLRCAETGAVVASVRPASGTEAWSPTMESVRVPAQQCAAQWLRLEPARQGGSEGLVWFDDLTLGGGRQDVGADGGPGA